MREEEQLDMSRIPPEDSYIVEFFTQEAAALAQADVTFSLCIVLFLKKKNNLNAKNSQIQRKRPTWRPG